MSLLEAKKHEMMRKLIQAAAQSLSDRRVKFLLTGEQAVRFYVRSYLPSTIALWIPPDVDTAGEVASALAPFDVETSRSVVQLELTTQRRVSKLVHAPSGVRIEVRAAHPIEAAGSDFRSVWADSMQSTLGGEEIHYPSCAHLQAACWMEALNGTGAERERATRLYHLMLEAEWSRADPERKPFSIPSVQPWDALRLPSESDSAVAHARPKLRLFTEDSEGPNDTASAPTALPLAFKRNHPC